MAETASTDLQALLAHSDWVRSLARRLVADQSEAEDLAQDAWVAALRTPPRDTLNLRGWLQRVVRNAFLQSRRATLRRRSREALAASPEALPSTAELVERATTHRELVTCVLRLAEPYRGTVLLRWFEGLAPRHIAQRMGVPVATVRTRLGRAHAELRTALSREHAGDSKPWMVAFLPLTGWLEPAVVAGGVLLVKKLPLVIAAFLAVAATVVVSWPNVSSPPARGGERLASAPQAAPDAGGGGSADASGARGDERRRAVVPETKAGDRAPAATLTVRGRALREDGTAAMGIGIGWDERAGAAAPLATTDADGRFVFATAPRQGELLATDPAWATLLAGMVSGATTSVEPVVVVAPAIALAGTAVDAQGEPVPGTAIAVQWPEGLRARLRVVLDYSVDRGLWVVADTGGRFALPRVAMLAGAQLLASHDGYVTWSQPLPAASDSQVRIVLERPRLLDGAVRGQVVTAEGAPVPLARVSLGLAAMRADAAGVFELPKAKGGADHRVLAVKAGFLPATHEIDRDPAKATEFLVLRLTGVPLSIQGQVVDEAGAPLPGVKVWADDVTVFGELDEHPATVEGIMAGAGERADIERIIAGGQAGSDPRRILERTPTVMWNFTVTGADGGFELRGLSDRDYTLVAMDPATLLRVSAGPLHAGRSGERIVLPASACHARIAGQVVSRAGAPIAGVRLVAMTDTIRLELSENHVSMAHAQAVGSAVTDAEGRFELLRFPKDRVYLRFEGDRVLPLEYGRGVAGGIAALAKGPVDELRIVMRQRVHVQVELADAANADEVGVLDDQGKELSINVFKGRSRTTMDRAQLRDGKTSVLALPDSAATLVLYRAGVEVRRAPLQLAVGDLNVVRL